MFTRLSTLEEKLDLALESLGNVMATCQGTQETLIDIRPDVEESRTHLEQVSSVVDHLQKDVSRNEREVKKKLDDMQENTDAIQFMPIRHELESIKKDLKKVRGRAKTEEAPPRRRQQSRPRSRDVEPAEDEWEPFPMAGRL